MNKTIARLWRGEIRPAEYSGDQNAESREIAHRSCRIAEKLEASLNEEELRLFRKYQDNTCDYINVLFEQAFCDGFSLAAKLTAEALVGSEESA